MTTDVTNVQNAYQSADPSGSPHSAYDPVLGDHGYDHQPEDGDDLPVHFADSGCGAVWHCYACTSDLQADFKKYDALNNSVQENVAGIRVVKSLSVRPMRREKFDKAAEEVRKDFTFVEKILAFNNPTMMFCMHVSVHVPGVLPWRADHRQHWSED